MYTVAHSCSLFWYCCCCWLYIHAYVICRMFLCLFPLKKHISVVSFGQPKIVFFCSGKKHLVLFRSANGLYEKQNMFERERTCVGCTAVLANILLFHFFFVLFSFLFLFCCCCCCWYEEMNCKAANIVLCILS